MLQIKYIKLPQMSHFQICTFLKCLPQMSNSQYSQKSKHLSTVYNLNLQMSLNKKVILIVMVFKPLFKGTPLIRQFCKKIAIFS
jgi:hypothetical protein